MTARRARLDTAFDGQVARVTLAAPKANIVDLAMMEELSGIFADLGGRRGLRAIVLGADGPNFSYGASVEEHLADRIGEALEALHGLLRRMSELPAPTLAAVRGQCLGGGFELVLGCDLLVAEESARLGCPEIKLGVFPPAASALLPARIGAGPAAALVLTGESWSATQASVAGLVTRVAEEGALEDAVDDWLAEDFLPRSPAALRHACHAARRPLRRALAEDLPAVERLYLEELMAEPDAEEGIRAFLEKRPPLWGSGGESA